MDIKSKTERSKNMSHIQSKNTSLELKVRKKLFADGFRYRINVSSLPGKPDIVLPKYRSVIFVNGCFWHRHNCKLATVPKTNAHFWDKKFKRNIENDKANYQLLTSMGWHVIVLWECEIKKDFNALMNSVEEELINLYYNQD